MLIDRDAALLSKAPQDTRTEMLQADIGILETLLPDTPAPRLVTASALLDVLSDEQIHRLCAVLGATRTPALFSLNVTGEVDCSRAGRPRCERVVPDL